LSPGVPDIAAIKVGIAELRIDGNGGVVVAECAVGVPHGAPRVAAIGVGDCQVHVAQAYRLVVIRQSPVVLTLAMPDIAAIEIGTAEFKIERDRLVVVGERAIELALAVPGNGAIVVSASELAALQFARVDQSIAGGNDLVGWRGLAGAADGEVVSMSGP